MQVLTHSHHAYLLSQSLTYLLTHLVYTSHEVFIDDQQVEWFEKTVKECPASEGWKIFVFTHAPPMGSGLRVLQENHVVNGCCWLNHSSKNTAKFIQIVRDNPSIKGSFLLTHSLTYSLTHLLPLGWFSGHFHLGQDYQDSITFPNDAKGKRGSCVFAQTAVMAKKSSRDTRQQSRLLRGTKTGFTIRYSLTYLLTHSLTSLIYFL